jgi:hypothetical protein
MFFKKIYISGGRANDRNTDKGEVGGSSPPRPTINHQYLCGHSHFFCLPVSCSKTHFPTICQLSGQADLSAKAGRSQFLVSIAKRQQIEVAVNMRLSTSAFPRSLPHSFLSTSYMHGPLPVLVTIASVCIRLQCATQTA